MAGGVATFRDLGRSRLLRLFAAGRRPRIPPDPTLLEAAARRSMSPRAFAYVAGAAGLERTARANRGAFDRWRIVPRMLRDSSQRELSVELFGTTLPAPLLLAPIGVLELAHRQADVAAARAAARAGLPMILSSQASRPMEACAAAMEAAAPRSPRWFQLYWSTSDELTASFIRRAEACGCSAIVLTLDTTMLGWRPRDLDLAYLPFLEGKGLAQYTSDPVFRASLEDACEDRPERPSWGLRSLLLAIRQAIAYPGNLGEKLSARPLRAVERFARIYSRPSLVWADVRRLRELTELPIVLKGILHPDDARLAVEHGADGLVVSNHGGRQVDGAVAALEALPAIVDAVGGRLPVLFDSGIRSGADVVKALALGAAAVCLGRPYVYGLALDGERGVTEVIENVVAELDLTLGLAGCRSVRELSPSCLEATPTP